MIKKIIVVVAILMATFSWAQDNSSSPYSYYGLGEIKFKGTQDTRAMGGLNITGDSLHLNLMNPASYSKLRLTTFEIGGTGNFNKLQTLSEEEKAQRVTLDYIAVGLPMGKFGFSFGLSPFSAVGYRNQNVSLEEGMERTRLFTGNGNINRVFVGGSYSLTKSFSFGLDFSYNFGKITSQAVEFLTEPAVQLGSRERNTSNIKGISANLGFLYNTKLNTKTSFYSSATYSPEFQLNSDNSRNIATIIYNINGSELVADKQDILVNDTKLIIPSKMSIGAGFGNSKKWLIGAEVTFAENSKLTNRFEDIYDVTFENATKISIGGFFIPKYDSFSSYFKRVVYRGGFRYESTGLIINNQSINDYGMNFGLGLPVGSSSIDVGFEFGKKGTTSNGLIAENYFNISVGLSLNDIWFKKRKID